MPKSVVFSCLSFLSTASCSLLQVLALLVEVPWCCGFSTQCAMLSTNGQATDCAQYVKYEQIIILHYDWTHHMLQDIPWEEL